MRVSTIAWDGNILAVDRQGTIGDAIMQTTKIRIIKNLVFAWTGYNNCGLIVSEWVSNGEKKQEWPEFQNNENDGALVVCVNLKTKDAFTYGNHPVREKIENKFMAWGSGSHFAIGAMAQNVNAVRAVEVACKFDINSGVGIDYVDLTMKDKKIMSIDL